MQYRKAGATFCTREWHLQSLQYLAWRARKQRAKKTGFNFTHKQQIMQKVFTTTYHYAKRLGNDAMSTKIHDVCEAYTQGQFYTGDSVHESVHAPKHYQGDKMECIDAMAAMLSHDEFRGFLRGNIFKYMWRYKDKNGLEDLRKANWYLDRLIKFENF